MNRKLKIGISLMIAICFVLQVAAVAQPMGDTQSRWGSDAGIIPPSTEEYKQLTDQLTPFAQWKNGELVPLAPGDTDGFLFFENPDGDMFAAVDGDIIPMEDFYNFWMKIVTDGEGPYTVEPEIDLYKCNAGIETVIYETGFEDNALNYLEWGQIDGDCGIEGGYYDGWSWSDARSCASGGHSFKCTMYDEYKNEQDDYLYMKKLVDISGNYMVRFSFDTWVQGEHANQGAYADNWYTVGGSPVYNPLDYLVFGVIDGPNLFTDWWLADNGDGQIFTGHGGGGAFIRPGNYYFFDTSIDLYRAAGSGYANYRDYTAKAEKIDGCPGWWHVWFDLPVSWFLNPDQVGVWFNWVSDKERVFEGAYVDNVKITVTESECEKIYQGHSQQWLEIDGDTWFEFPLPWTNIVESFEFECGSDMNPMYYTAIVKLKNAQGGFDFVKEIDFDVGTKIVYKITDLVLHDEFSGEVITDNVEQGSSIHVTWTTENMGNVPGDVVVKATAYKIEQHEYFSFDFEGMAPSMWGFGGNARLPYISDKFAWSGSKSLAFNDPGSLHYGAYDTIGGVFQESINMEGATEVYVDQYYKGKLGAGDEFWFLVMTEYSRFVYLSKLLIGEDTKVDWTGPMQPQCMYSSYNLVPIWNALVNAGETLDENGNPNYNMYLSYLLLNDGDEKFYYPGEYDWSGAYIDDLRVWGSRRADAVWSDQITVTGCDVGDVCTGQFLWDNVPFSCYEVVVEAILPDPYHDHEMSQEFCVLKNLKKMAKATGVDYTDCTPDSWCISNVVGNDWGDHYALATNCDTNNVPAGVNDYVPLGPGDACDGIDISHFEIGGEPDPGYYFFDFESDDGDWIPTATWDPVGDFEWTNTYDVNLYVQGGYTAENPPATANSGTGLWGTILYAPHTNAGGFSYLSQTFDFSGFTSPEIRWRSWEQVFGSFDYCQLRVNGDLVWGPSWDYTGTIWQERIVDLSAYAGLASVEIQFEMWATTVVNYAGWYIDDVYIGDPMVLGNALANCSIVLDQDFEEIGWDWDSPPTGWSTNTFFYFNSLYGSAQDGSQWAFSYSNTDSMVSPMVTLENGTSTLTFWYRAESSVYPQSFEVYVNGQASGDLVWSETDFTNTIYALAVVDLSMYAGQTIYIELWNSGPTGLYGHCIDTIQIETCEEDPVPPGDEILFEMVYQVDLSPGAYVHLEIAGGQAGPGGICDGCADHDCVCPPGMNAWTTIATITGTYPGDVWILNVNLGDYLTEGDTVMCLRLRLDTMDYEGAAYAGPGIGFHLHEYTIFDVLYDELTDVTSDYYQDFEDGMLEHQPQCIVFGEYWQQNESNHNEFTQVWPAESVDNALIWSTDVSDAYFAWLFGQWSYSIGSGAILSFEMSADGGENWYVIAREYGPATELTYVPIPCTPFDLTPWAGKNILVRVHIDNADGIAGWVSVKDFLIMGKIDTVAPTATISLSGNLVGPGSYAGPVTVTITAKDDTKMGEIHYILDGSKFVVSGDKATFKVSTDGTHTVEYWAVDAAGNEGAHGTVSFSIDASPPTVAITAPQPGLYLFGNKLLSMSKPIIIGAFTIEATASDAQGIFVVKFLLDGTVIGEDTSAPYSAYCAVKHMGAGTIKVIAEDGVGNTAEDTLDITYFKFL